MSLLGEDQAQEALVDQAPAEAPTVKLCAFPECETPLPADSHPARRYCDEHKPDPKKKRAAGPPRRDPPPRSVNVNLGAAARPPARSSAPELDAIEERGRQVCKGLAGLLLVAGRNDPKIRADALDVHTNADAFGQALREVAAYEEWMRRWIGQPSETAGRAVAWMNLTTVTVAIAMPILIRHEILPERYAKMFGMLLGAGIEELAADLPAPPAAFVTDGAGGVRPVTEAELADLVAASNGAPVS